MRLCLVANLFFFLSPLLFPIFFVCVFVCFFCVCVVVVFCCFFFGGGFRVRMEYGNKRIFIAHPDMTEELVTIIKNAWSESRLVAD